MAVNAEGESEPLVAEKSIIAKNPFGKYFNINNTKNNNNNIHNHVDQNKYFNAVLKNMN